MSSYILPVFLFAVGNVLLFYKKSLGISVLLFIIPFLIFWYSILYKNKKIKNKKGFLLIIPILLLASTYLFYDSFFFRYMNIIIIPILFTMMNICVFDRFQNVKEGIKNMYALIIEPITCIHNALEEVRKAITKNWKIKNTTKKEIETALMVLPIILVVFLLLISADIVFKSIFENILEFYKTNLSGIIDGLYGKLLMFILFFVYVISTIYYLLFHYDKEKDLEKEKEEKREKKDPSPINILLVSLNIIYLFFDIIQIKSLLLHSVSASINYAEYARQGFFQLLFVSVINLTILFVAGKYKEKEKKKNRFTNIMSTLLVCFTFIIILSSFLRMNLYEAKYGYTLLRLLVYITLITESIMLFPTILYIWNSNIKIEKYYFSIILIVYVVINFISIDKIIAERNIKRYEKKKDIDIEYLENNASDNIEVLLSFYNKVEDKEVKKSLEKYFKNYKIKTDHFAEWNLTKYKAKKKLNKQFIK